MLLKVCFCLRTGSYFLFRQVTFQKVKTVCRSRDLLGQQEMAYPSKDAQRPTHIGKYFTTIQNDFMRVELSNFPSGTRQKTKKTKQGEAKPRVQLLFFQKIDLVYFENRDHGTWGSRILLIGVRGILLIGVRGIC